MCIRDRLTEFVVGSRVYVRTHKKSDKEKGKTKKMYIKWEGPCTVIGRRGLNTYLVEMPDGSRDTHHISNLHH